MVRCRKRERFIETVEALPKLYTEFDAGQWAALVDSMTVHTKDRITFNLTCGMEIDTQTQTAWRSASSEAGHFSYSIAARRFSHYSH